MRSRAAEEKEQSDELEDAGDEFDAARVTRPAAASGRIGEDGGSRTAGAVAAGADAKVTVAAGAVAKVAVAAGAVAAGAGAAASARAPVVTVILHTLIKITN